MKEQSHNHFIEEFKIKLEEVKNEKALIQNELNQITSFTTSVERSTKLISESFNYNTNSVFNLSHLGDRSSFNKVFSEYRINGEYHLTEKEKMFSGIIDYQQEPKLFAEYYSWLEELQSNPSKKAKKNNVSLHQKMLILHYLGFDPIKYNKSNVTEIIFVMFGLEKNKDTLRKSLSYLSAGKNKVRTEENLSFVMHLFEKHGLTEISNTIQKDIKKLGETLGLTQE